MRLQIAEREKTGEDVGVESDSVTCCDSLKRAGWVVNALFFFFSLLLIVFLTALPTVKRR